MNNRAGFFDDARGIAIIRESLQPVKPDPPRELPEKFKEKMFPLGTGCIPGIGTVLFDIYGTLFTSAAGDIGVSGEYLPGSLDEFALQWTGNYTGEELKQYFREEVIKTHERMFPVTPYPEVLVEQIWEQFPGRPKDLSPREFALRYELAINPVYPMPGVLETLAALQSLGLTLGIISNAQFFSPLLFEACFGKSLKDLGFTEELLIFSYQMGEAKPAPSLFRKAREYLDKNSGKAETCLYIGNDMLNDIYGADAFGFKTVLFAGDARSLRLREGNRLTEKTIPTAVIKNIPDIMDLVAGGSHVSP